jgi:hypothetical protein
MTVRKDQMNKLEVQFLRHRLRILQSQCSAKNPDKPDAIICIAGLDGGNNQGSLSVLKYLLLGANGKDLIDPSLDSDEDYLEELVMLVQEHSVSVFWTLEIRHRIGDTLRQVCPFLVEYGTHMESDEDLEENIDVFEARKCAQFKRMILEAVDEGGMIGLAVPLGYDELVETESWPLLKSFALDQLLCPTGFFTRRYGLVDMSDTFYVLFRSVDSFSLRLAHEATRTNILPHLQQVFRLLDTQSSEARTRLSLENVTAPLDMLYDFGAMHAQSEPDPLLRPVTLCGSGTDAIGSTTAIETAAKGLLGSAAHLVVESCEPSSGLRFCRTFFLRQVSHPDIRQPNQTHWEEICDATDSDTTQV